MRTSFLSSVPAPRAEQSVHPPLPLPPPLRPASDPGARPRFLSETDCHDIMQRLSRYASGGGYTATTIVSTWLGYVRWGRNQLTQAGEICTPHVQVVRNLNGGSSHWVILNETTDEALVAAARRAERLARLEPEQPLADLSKYFEPEPSLAPPLFSETTYQLAAGARTAAAGQMIQSAAQAGMLSAGYLEVSAHSQAVLTSFGYATYFQYTWARASVTVRDPKGVGSGWAGMEHHDWSKIDGTKIAAIALEKCLASRNPVKLEPGRYTTILESQATAELVKVLFGTGQVGNGLLDRDKAEKVRGSYFNAGQMPGLRGLGLSKIGERVVDARLSLGADPMDPELGFPPTAPRNWFLDQQDNIGPHVYHPVTWIENGVLTALAYDRDYALDRLGRNTGLPNERAFRMQVTGPTSSVEEMIATTTRGVLVTRFNTVIPLSDSTTLCSGYTRDGLWLIEKGKISHPITNFRFVEDVLSFLNRVEQIGVPQRAFLQNDWSDYWELPSPGVAPPLKVRDFNFSALSDAI